MTNARTPTSGELRRSYAELLEIRLTVLELMHADLISTTVALASSMAALRALRKFDERG